MKRNNESPPPPLKKKKMMKSEEDEKGKEKKKKKTISRTSKSSSFFTNNKRPTTTNNNNNAFRTTKKHSRERYLRDDIFCGIKQAPVAYKGKDKTKWILDVNAEEEEEKEEEKSGVEAKSMTTKENNNNNNIGNDKIIYVVDANVCLHQLDVVSHPKAMRNVVVCTTVLEEVRNRSRNAYERVRRLCLEASSSTGIKQRTRGERISLCFLTNFTRTRTSESRRKANRRTIGTIGRYGRWLSFTKRLSDCVRRTSTTAQNKKEKEEKEAPEKQRKQKSY
jgi:hypothetical protein